MTHTTDMALDLNAKIGALTGHEVKELSHEVFLIVSVAAGLSTAVLQEAQLADENGQLLPSAA